MATNEKIIIGMDAGGTKTKAIITDLEGNVLLSLEGEGMNVNSFGAERTGKNLRDMLDIIKRSVGSLDKVEAICIGIAGISNPITRSVLRTECSEAGIRPFPLVIGDQEAALYGAHAGGDGMILIAGTGSVCFGMRNTAASPETVTARCGGWGHIIDDEGSAYAIGRDILSAVMRSEDHRNPPTVMRDLVLDELYLNDPKELIQFIYDPEVGKKEIAALAPIVMKGYEAREEAAIRILDKAAEELSSLVVPVANQLQLRSGSLALCGGLLQKNTVLQNLVRKKLKDKLPLMECVEPSKDAAYGAIIYAMRRLSEKDE